MKTKEAKQKELAIDVALGEYDESEILTYLFESKVYGGIYEQKFLEDYGKDLSNKR